MVAHPPDISPLVFLEVISLPTNTGSRLIFTKGLALGRVALIWVNRLVSRTNVH
jgi:hypothetical protein